LASNAFLRYYKKYEAAQHLLVLGLTYLINKLICSIDVIWVIWLLLVEIWREYAHSHMETLENGNTRKGYAFAAAAVI
jgi:hypothetical protein